MLYHRATWEQYILKLELHKGGRRQLRAAIMFQLPVQVLGLRKFSSTGLIWTSTVYTEINQ